MESVEVYTDGGCHGNPGPGGWAFVVAAEGRQTRMKGAQAHTTNNRMELTAVIRALEYVTENGLCRGTVRIITDSQYVKNGITSWVKSWEKNGWRTSSKQPVKNKDLWQQLRQLTAECAVSWGWVRGHAGNELNEACDALVQGAIAELE